LGSIPPPPSRVTEWDQECVGVLHQKIFLKFGDAAPHHRRAAQHPTRPRKLSHYQLLKPALRWHASCLSFPMQITNLILQKLSQQVAYGNPWWGLVVANEYLSTANPLHRALVHHFRARLGSTTSNPLAEKLVNGSRYADLPQDLRALIGCRTLIKRGTLALNLRTQRRGSRRSPIRRIGAQRTRPHAAIRITRRSHADVPHKVQVVARTASSSQ
jgi:hypothetical protein